VKLQQKASRVRALDRISVMTDNTARRRPMDDLDRSIARRTAKNARYPELLQAEVRRQRLIAGLVAERKANHLTQAEVAAEMNVSQSVVAEIESSKADVRYSTLDRYAEAVTKHKKRLDLTPA
jgi:ribosome-binding protein aMBF1 (putative translation factor)